MVELTDVSKKRIDSILGVKPFKKNPEGWVTQLLLSEGNNILVDTASHHRQPQNFTGTSIKTSDVVSEMMVMAGLFRRFIVADSGSGGS